VLRTPFGPKTEEIKGGWIKMHEEAVFFTKYSGMIKSRRMNGIITHRISVKKSKGNTPLGISRYR
jgi:hypothetical protein